MYALYKRTRSGKNTTQYKLIKEKVSIFGCNKGYIPRLLKLKIPPCQSEPFYWHVDVLSELNNLRDHLSNTLIIDLKPKQNKTNLSLYEMLDVWGFSKSGWTPILLRLNGLFVGEDPKCVNRNDFVREDADLEGPIYEFLYLTGSVRDGTISGLWCPPPASPTNGALLWPETLNYFVRCIQERTPEILDPAVSNGRSEVQVPLAGLLQSG